MALDIGSIPPDPGRFRPRGPFSSLTRRIFAINAIALGILVAGVLYLDRFEAGLIEARGQGLKTQGEIIAGALAEAATSGPESARIKLDLANQILHRLVVPTNTRARLFGTGGQLVADSRRLLPTQQVIVRELSAPGAWSEQWSNVLYDRIASLLSSRATLDLYRESPRQSARDYEEVVQALLGNPTFKVRRTREGSLLLSVALPVQRLKLVLGAFMLSAEAIDIDQSLREQRLAILGIFGTSLVVTVLLSLFLAGTIARPVRQLAEAADRVRSGISRRIPVPDFTLRRDEIGDLSGALRDMTQALYRRMDDIEKFAADVAHEIKNPLTSLRSAVETFDRTDDPVKQRRLIEIIGNDVKRLDRLITEISDASRLDAELSRAEKETIDLPKLLAELIGFYQDRDQAYAGQVSLRLPSAINMELSGIAGRLGQVFRNLIDNALSFSPAEAPVVVTCFRDDGWAVVTIEDRGPGIPNENLETIFERFYSERPSTETFGTHSGLGLNIAKQIVEAHGGSLRVQNCNPGARFEVRLPF